nr:type II toxin-antitoxin system RelE/ParE family toxin [Nesterenkonia alba]
MTVDLPTELRKLDPQVARRLRSALRAVASLDDPRARGKALTGNLAGHWRYRVGDYRIVCDIQDEKLVIVALDLGHRRTTGPPRRLKSNLQYRAEWS